MNATGSRNELIQNILFFDFHLVTFFLFVLILELETFFLFSIFSSFLGVFTIFNSQHKKKEIHIIFITAPSKTNPVNIVHQISLLETLLFIFQDDSFLETIVSVTVYELTHLCCTNFGPAVFGNDKAVYQLLSNLAKHKTVQDDIWEKGNKGLMQLLHDLEVFYPISVADLLLVLIPFCSSKERCDTVCA